MTDPSSEREAQKGELIGVGRSADIYSHGSSRVLRRLRNGVVGSAEPSIMRQVRRSGFPAPEVFSVDGPDMVLDRVDGPDLIGRLTKRPWEAKALGRLLGDLHRQLASIPVAAEDIASNQGVSSDAAEAYVHGDLHPGNVLLGPSGPVVIDWEGAHVGLRDADTATTWLLLEAADPDDLPAAIRPFVGLIRRVLLKSFLSSVDTPRSSTISVVCHKRMGDKNMRPQEIERIRVFAEQHGSTGGA